MINNNDLKFILFKTGLSLKKLLLLIEEDRDFNLVLESISKMITEEDKKYFHRLSDKLKAKLAVYYASKDKDYDIDEKTFISNIISYNYDYFYKTARKIKNGQKQEIKQFLNIIKNEPVDYSKFNVIAKEFSKNGYKDLGFHLKDWVGILSQSKELILSTK